MLGKQLELFNQPPKSIIIGLHGCYCHPFNSWSECEKYHRQKFKIGDKVKNRCLHTTGVIYEVLTNYFVIVKYGELPRDRHLEHSAELEKL